VIKKQQKNQEYKHKMCKTNVKMDLYYVNICKHEHEKNMTRLWCKIVLKITIEQIEENEGSYSYSYPVGDLVQGSFKEAFMCASSKEVSWEPF
jgi:hypothetical protein